MPIRFTSTFLPHQFSLRIRDGDTRGVKKKGKKKKQKKKSRYDSRGVLGKQHCDDEHYERKEGRDMPPTLLSVFLSTFFPLPTPAFY